MDDTPTLQFSEIWQPKHKRSLLPIAHLKARGLVKRVDHAGMLAAELGTYLTQLDELMNGKKSTSQTISGGTYATASIACTTPATYAPL